MKRLMGLIMTGTLCAVMLLGCGNSAAEKPVTTSVQKAESTPEPQGVSDQDIRAAVEKITSARDSIRSCATEQLDGWTTTGSFLALLFDDNAYKDAGSTGYKTRGERIAKIRISAREDLEEAKKLLGTNGEGDFYKATKDYYIAVNKFLSLVSTFPAGYSKLTFSQAVTSAIDDCETAYGEVSFY